MSRCRFTLSALALLCVASASFAQIEPMTNDECTTPIVVSTGINPGAPAGLSDNVYTNDGSAVALSTGPAMCISSKHDVWFSYTAPDTGLVTVSTCTPAGFNAGTLVDTVLQILTADCPATTALACNDEFCSSRSQTAFNAVSGVTYLIRVAAWSNVSITPGTFYLSISAAVPPPCAVTTPVFDGVNPAAPAGADGVTFTNVGTPVPVSPPALCISSKNEVWFSYTATGTGILTVSTCTPGGFTPGTLSDTVLQILTDTCPAPVSIACNDEFCSSRSQLTAAVTLGTTYLIRVCSWSSASTGTFYLTISPPAPPPPPPANDECSAAIALVDGENGPFTNVDATDAPGFTTPCGVFGSTIGFKDVFFTYTAGGVCAHPVEVKTCNPVGFPGTLTDTQITVWDPILDCPTPAGPPIACGDDAPGCGPSGFQSLVTFSANPGQTYLIRVNSWSSVAAGTFMVTVTPGAGSAAAVTLGAGCSDGGGPGPSLTVDAPPVFDTVVTFSIAGAAPGSVGMLFISPPGAPTAMPGGCTLFVVNGSMQFLTFLSIDGTGSTSFMAYVPEIPEWECLPVYMQGVTLPGTPFYQLTDGLFLTLGY